MPIRHCSQCLEVLPTSHYTRSQLSRGSGVSRCVTCVHGYDYDGPNQSNTLPETARRNDAHRASFDPDDLENPFAEGAFRWVARGRYTHGERRGQGCVCKWFKTGVVFGDEFFEKDIQAVDRALQIIERFNEIGFVNKLIKLNIPEVWTFDDNCGLRWTGAKVLQEPFVQNYQKFNSNTGWNDDRTPWKQVMQALSHFSYHSSGRQVVLCDLQGGIYSDSVVLTDPVILSQSGDFGVTDLGAAGICTFFSQHECNTYCRSSWSRPRDQRMYHRPVAGTTMVRRRVPTVAAPLRTAYYG